MKKLNCFSFLLVFLLGVIPAMAGKVSQADALKKAKAVLPGRQFVLQKYSTTSKGQEVKDPFFIFNVEYGGGFVLVSADDRTEPILGYSSNGNIDLEKIPDNVKKWLEGYASQMAALEEGRLVVASKAGTRGDKTNISPLMSSTWNQYEPYNLMCPDATGKDYNESGYDMGNRCVTGCVATAIAQVMYYYKSPASSPAIPAYTSKTLGIQLGELPATTFKWDKMKNTYSNKETGESADAVAELMRYVGQAFQMNYNTAESGGSAASVRTDAMINYFGYSKNLHRINRDNYSATQWENIIYEELRNNRPVPYSGQSSTSGHQFVCDGYKDGLFYLNWGWGGHLDGYFVLSIADPGGDQGAGGSNGAYQYDQDAIINFAPPSGVEEEVPFVKSVVDPNTLIQSYTRASASSDFTDVKLEGQYQPIYNYTPTTTYPLEIGWALYLNDQMIQCVGSSNIVIDYTNPPLEAGWHYTYKNNISVSFGNALSDGKYQLRQVFRKQGSSTWNLCDDYGVNYLVAEISGNSLEVRGIGNSTDNFRVNKVTISDKPCKGNTVNVTVNLTNDGETNQEQVRIWLQKNGSSDWKNVASVTGYVGPGGTGEVKLSFIPDDSGSFTLKVTSGASEEALTTAPITIANVVSVTSDGINYSCIPDYAEAIIISGVDKSVATLTIPSSVQAEGVACKVKSIKEKAFWNFYRITSLVIPDGVESIGDNAFSYCYNLKSLIIPNGVKTIGNYAFAGCEKLEKFELPSTLISIGNYVISNCSNLSAVISHFTNPIQISDNTFMNSTWDSSTNTYVYTPSSATLFVPIGSKSKYEAITGWTKFAKIEEGEVKEAVVDGLNYSYATGSKTAIVISGDYSSLTSVVIPASVPIGGVDYKVTAIGAGAFDGYYSIKSVTINANLESIGASAFFNTNIPGIILPASLKSIGDNAFSYCYKINAMVVPEGVETIGRYVFSGCSSMTRLELPSTLTSIGEYVISGTSQLEKVISYITDPFTVSDNSFVTQEYIDENTVYNPSSATLYVPAGSKSKYEAITGWTKFAKIVEIPTSTGIKVAKGMTTYTSEYNLDFSSLGDGVKAYVATGYDYDKNTIWLTRVKDVPAGTPILVQAPASDTPYDIPVKASSGCYYKNMLVGNLSGGDITLSATTGDMTNYYLSNGKFLTATGSNTIGNGKAYLQIPTTPPAATVGSSQAVKLNDYGFASFCGSQDLDFTDVEGLKAFAVTGYDDANGTIWLTRVNRVSARTPLLLKGGSGASYTIPSVAVGSYYVNMMKGNLSGSTITIFTTTYTTDGDMTNYYLKGNQLLKATDKGNTIGNGKAYMQIPSKHVTRSIEDIVADLLIYGISDDEPEVISIPVARGINGDGTTNIREKLAPEQMNDVYYNLQGQRVENPTKGVYIKNGKKVVVK